MVPCGKCPACVQQKALLRTSRIRLHQPQGFIFLFVTLTYSNDYVPYVLRDDLLSDSISINIYRNCRGRYVFSKYSGLRFKKEAGIEVVSTVSLDSCYRSDSEVMPLKSLNGLGKNKIGVLYYSDLQDFFKRLRINYERKFNKRPVFDYFACAEYGGYSFRPHFHFLLSIPASDETAFRSLIVENWPYADSRRTAKFIELARDAASYVASYVNSSFSLSSCLSSDAFRQKHSHSQNLGLSLDCFSLHSLLSQIDKGDLHYYRKQKFDGTSSVMPLLIPKYVINRYFPIFKGVSRFATFTLRSILISPDTLFDKIGDYEETFRCNYFLERFRESGLVYGNSLDISFKYNRSSDLDFPNLSYTFSRLEIYSIVIRLVNAQFRFMAETGLNAFDFADYYIRCWDLYHSTLIKDSLTSVECLADFGEFYFNSNDLVHGLVESPTLDDVLFNPNYNSYESVVIKSQNLTKTFYQKDKTKKVVNYSMSSLGYDV